MEDVRSAWKGTIARVKIAQCNSVLDIDVCFDKVRVIIEGGVICSLTLPDHATKCQPKSTFFVYHYL